jgi:hypothetical protein
MKPNFRNEREYEQLQKALKLWKESEWRLHFFRNETRSEPKEPNDEEILTWAKKNNPIL